MLYMGDGVVVVKNNINLNFGLLSFVGSIRGLSGNQDGSLTSISIIGITTQKIQTKQIKAVYSLEPSTLGEAINNKIIYELIKNYLKQHNNSLNNNEFKFVALLDNKTLSAIIYDQTLNRLLIAELYYAEELNAGRFESEQLDNETISVADKLFDVLENIDISGVRKSDIGGILSHIKQEAEEVYA